MAYVKIKPIKIGTHIDNALDYIQQTEKTDGKLLISSFMCSYKNAFEQFENSRNRAMKKGNNVAHHIVQSFSPEDNISPEQALEIGKELMKRMYPNYQYVIATHIDRGHIHNHIICNSVDFINYKKLHSNKESLSKLRAISDEICRENSLSIIKPVSVNHRKELKATIDEAIKNSTDFNEFLDYMQSKNYEIKKGKYYSFKGVYDESFLRLSSSSLGTAYSENAVRKRISENVEITNKQKHIYDGKSIRMSNRKRLKSLINSAVKKSETFDVFLDYMQKYGCEVKQGKHLAFKINGTERFIRCDSLDDDYSERMLRLKIENFEVYRQIKQEQADNRIDKIKVSEDGISSRFSAVKDINTNIRIINLMNKSGVKNVEELREKVKEFKGDFSQRADKIKAIQSEISSKFDVINSLRIYWQYKPTAAQAKAIADKEKRREFMAEHNTELEKFKTAIYIINNARGTDGKLPSAEQLHKEINQLNEIKENLVVKNQKTKEEMKNFENALYNIEQILGENKSTNEEKTAKKEDITR